MNDERDFEAWKRARSAGTVPRGFADRVMAGLPPREKRLRRTGTMLFLSRVAVTLLAVTVFLYRAACAFSVFFTE